MANAEISFAVIHHDWRSPSLPRIVADPYMRFLSGSIFIPFVEGIGRVETAFVPGEPHTERESTFIGVGTLLFEDVKFGSLNGG